MESFISLQNWIKCCGSGAFLPLEPNTQKVFKRIWRIRGKNLCVHGEDAKKLLRYSPSRPKDKRHIFLDSFYLHYMGWIKT